MRERLRKIIGAAADKVAIFTFHSFGVEIINRHPEYFFSGQARTPIDDLGKLEILTKILDKKSLDFKLASQFEGSYIWLDGLQKLIAELRNNAITPDEFKAVLQSNDEFYKNFGDSLGDIFETPKIGPHVLPKAIAVLGELRKNSYDKDVISGIREVGHHITQSLGEHCRFAEKRMSKA